MEYVTIKNGVVSPITERKQLYYLGREIIYDLINIDNPTSQEIIIPTITNKKSLVNYYEIQFHLNHNSEDKNNWNSTVSLHNLENDTIYSKYEIYKVNCAHNYEGCAIWQGANADELNLNWYPYDEKDLLIARFYTDGKFLSNVDNTVRINYENVFKPAYTPYSIYFMYTYADYLYQGMKIHIDNDNTFIDNITVKVSKNRY